MGPSELVHAPVRPQSGGLVRQRRGELTAHTNLFVYRSRTTLPEGGFHVGERCDLLRRDGGGLRLARREVRLDHTVAFGGPVTTLI
jgi:3-phenylpropionate/cinnamic acid dioxygenase small subunit